MRRRFIILPAVLTFALLVRGLVSRCPGPGAADLLVHGRSRARPYGPQRCEDQPRWFQGGGGPDHAGRAGRDKEFHNHLLYDFQAHKLYIKVLSDPAVPCGSRSTRSRCAAGA